MYDLSDWERYKMNIQNTLNYTECADSLIPRWLVPVHRMRLGLSLQVPGLALMRPVRVFVGGEEKVPSQRWSYWA